jgi:hypothetical protein
MANKKQLPSNLYTARKINLLTDNSIVTCQVTFLLSTVLRIESPHLTASGGIFNVIPAYTGPVCTVILNNSTFIYLAESGSNLLAAFVQFHELEASRIPGLLRN